MRSNSWSDSLDDFRMGSLNEINRTLLGDSQRNLYDNFKKCYAEMLYCWGMLVERTHVLKFLSTPPPNVSVNGVEFVTECKRCKRSTRGPYCSNVHCKIPLLYCTLCRLPVRGSAISCLACSWVLLQSHKKFYSKMWTLFSHGGHLEHLKRWFEKNTKCAYGCGCDCQNVQLIDM